jgi:hypothetical protein
MKKLLLFLFLLWSVSSLAQDTIVEKSGTSIPARVMEIAKDNVRYKKFTNPDGPTYVISKSDIIFIRYQNGSVDTFSVAVSSKPDKPVVQPLSEMYLKGQQDAELYYKHSKPATTWALMLTIPLNAIGVIPAVAFSANPPKKENLLCPDQNLLGNPDYLKGYTEKAKDKKGSRVMKNFAIGLVASFVMYGSILVATK